jgi:hypothetical protein
VQRGGEFPWELSQSAAEAGGTSHSPNGRVDIGSGLVGTRPLLTHLRNLLDRQQWLALERPAAAMNSLLPEVKLRQFALEARSLDAGRMQEMAPAKRYTLAATLIELQNARVLDDLTEMFIKRMMRVHRLGREALALDRLKYQERTDRLVRRLHEVILAWSGEGSSEQRLDPRKARRVLSRGCHRRNQPVSDRAYQSLRRLHSQPGQKPPQPDYGYTLKQTASPR